MEPNDAFLDTFLNAYFAGDLLKMKEAISSR
jgi:hypothetical protein